MMSSSKDKIIDRVKKLLAISNDDGASEAEIETVMNIAMKLMGEHHLTEEDLAHEPVDDYTKVDASNFEQVRSFVGKKIYGWESSLSMFVSKFVGVPVYEDARIQLARKNGICLFDEWDEPRYGKSFVFYGVSEDARLASDVYDETRRLIATMAVAKYGKVYIGDGAMYSQGFVSGLYSQVNKAAKRLEQTSNSRALILLHRRNDLIQYKEDKARDWLHKSKGIKLQKGSGRWGSDNGSWSAYQEGQSDGQRANVDGTRRKKIGV